VSIVIPACHSGDETIKSETKIRADAKKVNQISQGSTVAFENFV